MTKIVHTKFHLGQVVITAHAQARLDSTSVQEGLSRHAAGDWGDIPPHDAAENDAALIQGEGGFMSAYGTGDERFWIITEADRSVTTVLLPEDY
ncbi:MAG: hypothetical protein ACJ8FY_05470 [Gemmataceae bacterium]